MKNQNSDPIGIIFDLNAILDTRFGAIQLVHPELAKEIQNSPSYYLRKDDNWKKVHPKLNHSLIHLRNQRYDEELIRKSKITMVTRYSLDVVNDIITRGQTGDPEHSGVFLVLNVYPFDISEDLITRIARVFTIQLGYPDIPIGFINKPLKEINPTFLKDNNIRHWYCYGFQDWLRENLLDANEEGAMGVGCPEVKMYCPRLPVSNDDIEAHYDELREEVNFDEFAWTKAAFANFINLNFLTPSTFSILDLDKLTKVEYGEAMERKDAVSVLFEAVRDISERVGQQQVVDKEKVDQSIELISQNLNELAVYNTPKGMRLFRAKLAETMVEFVRLYNQTPFNPADDIETLVDNLSLEVDTNDDHYKETESVYNALGVKTIKREVTIGNEKIYRCICAEEVYVKSTNTTYKVNQILKPSRSNPIPKFTSIDDLQFSNYFREVI